MITLADVFMYCMLDDEYPADKKEKEKKDTKKDIMIKRINLMTDYFNKYGKYPTDEQLNKLYNDTYGVVEKQEDRKETKQSLKDELIELIKNVDEEKLKNKTLDSLLLPKNPILSNLIDIILHSCQKTKELTLKEKLIADGWERKYGVNGAGEKGYELAGYIKNDTCIVFGVDIERIRIKYKIKNYYIEIPYTEDYEVIKEAVEFVRSM